MACWYSYAWTAVNIAPKIIVKTRPVIKSFLLSCWRAWWDQVTVQPDNSNISVLISGRSKGSKALDPFDLPLINTLILLLSGCTVTWSHHALQHDNRKDFITGLVLTIILGAIFTAVQAYEYQHATFACTDGIYASTFYMAI